MKKVIVLIFMFIIFADLTSCTGGKEMKISSFQKIEMSVTGTAANTDLYEVISDGSEIIISFYSGGWNYNDNISKEECLIKRKKLGKQAYEYIIELMNRYKVMSWDGFSKTDPDILDGESISFFAAVNDNINIEAHGSNASPKFYYRFQDAIEDLLNRK